MGKPGRDGALSPVNPGSPPPGRGCVLEGPPLGPGGEDITWPDQVAPRDRKASSTRKIKPQTSNLKPMRLQPACHRLLRVVPSLAPQHALTRNVWRAILSHTRELLTNPGARYPPGPVLEQLTAPTPGVRHALHRASALTEQLNDEVLDLALEPLRVLYPQTHIPPTGTSDRLGRLG